MFSTDILQEQAAPGPLAGRRLIVRWPDPPKSGFSVLAVLQMVRYSIPLWLYMPTDGTLYGM